ncbi:hypothetical protein ACHAXR_005143 [Thalassiosira sp. AJA248-18]
MEILDTCKRLSEGGSARSSLTSCGGECDSKHRLPVAEEKHAYPCKDTYSFVPPSPPEKWPQRPILLRPSPESGMKIRGVRYSSSMSYLPLPGTGYCNGCTLPINNGLEKPGECLVVDFESDHFIGTAMLRVKNVCDPLNTDNNKAQHGSSSYYFHNRKRTFQGIVRGRFKSPGIPMSECVTGQVFNHPAGHLPPRFIMKGAISIISHLAPQLQARLDGDCPRFMSPLVSTAQSAMSCQRDNNANNDIDGADESIEATMSEPQPSDPSSLLQNLSGTSTTIPPDSDCITTRIKTRKRAFDKLYARRNNTHTFDPNSEYTFEFFQHLLLFDEFALNFVKPIGRHPLHGMLNGQPLKFMAAHQILETSEKGKIVDEEMRWLWSFDLWHESLYKDAKLHE